MDDHEELGVKQGRITALLERSGLEAVLLGARHNFAWLTGGGQNYVNQASDAGVAALLVTFAGFYLVFGNMDRALTMVIGFAIVGTMIELLHLVCHCRIPHRNALMKSLVRLHRYHHHVDSHNFYGVSSSMGDRLFGTFPVAAVPVDEERM